MIHMFTRSNVLGENDDLVTWGLEEPVSHYGIMFFDKIVVHSSWRRGVEIMPIEKFLESRILISTINHKLSPRDEGEAFKYCVSNLTDKKELRGYDWKFFFWLAYRAVLLKFFKRPVPNKIYVQDKEDTLCTEVFNSIPDVYKAKIDLKSISTPYRLYLALRRI